MGLLDGYVPDHGYDEAFESDGSARDLYRGIVERFSHLEASELRRIEGLVEDQFRRQGITFTVYGDDQGIERTWPMDLFPRLIAAAEWRELACGLEQRVTALNRFLADLYSGPREAIAAGVVPDWLVLSSSGFERSAFGITVPHDAHCMVAGIDLVRGADGHYAVLEDNLRNPSGISYVIENRAAMANAFPALFADHIVEPVEQYGRMLRDALESVAPPGARDQPTVVVLTPGVFNSAYYEHAFLARSMGLELVEGRDLVVDDHAVYARTIEGLVPVDVIYRRIDDDFLDPVGFRPDSTLGVPGLLGAVRAGTVTLCNAIGNGVADDKAVYPYVPELIRFYLGEEPIISNVPTYVMWEEDQRRACLDRLDELVVKPVAESGAMALSSAPMRPPANSRRPGQPSSRIRATGSSRKSFGSPVFRASATTGSRAVTSTCGRSCSPARRPRSFPAGSPGSRCGGDR
jgi:uncharacterized circularly permuted ATP-grasp superfamily protein